MDATNVQGSALYDASLGDPNLIEEMYQAAVREQSAKIVKKKAQEEYHPSRRGYTRVVEKLDDLIDNVTALRAESGHWKPHSTRFVPRPIYPHQAVKDRLAARSRARRDAAIAASQARHKERKERGDIA